MIIRLIIFIFFLSSSLNADALTDQWQESDNTYRDLIDQGYEVRAYDMTTLRLVNGYILMLFVTVLQKEKEVYECHEYQTLDENMQTFEISLACRKSVQPYQRGVGT